MKLTTDIDIDVANRESVLNLFEHTPASLIKDKGFVKHNTGVYFTDIPVASDGLATVDRSHSFILCQYKPSTNTLRVNSFE